MGKIKHLNQDKAILSEALEQLLELTNDGKLKFIVAITNFGDEGTGNLVVITEGTPLLTMIGEMELMKLRLLDAIAQTEEYTTEELH